MAKSKTAFERASSNTRTFLRKHTALIAQTHSKVCKGVPPACKCVVQRAVRMLVDLDRNLFELELESFQSPDRKVTEVLGDNGMYREPEGK